MAILIKAEEAFLFHQVFYRPGFRKQHFQVQVVVLADLINKAIGLLMKTPGIQCKDLDVFFELGRHVDQDHIFRATERDRDIVELGEGLAEDILKGFLLELFIALQYFLFSQHSKTVFQGGAGMYQLAGTARGQVTRKLKLMKRSRDYKVISGPGSCYLKAE